MSQQNTPPERWLPVVGWEGYYEVSDLGRVRSIDRVVMRKNGAKQRIYGRVLRSWINDNGYRLIELRRPEQSKRTLLRVHRLMLLAFVGPPPVAGMDGAHNDGARSNNRLDNLRWATRADNLADRLLHGTMNRGESSGTAKLKASEVGLIRESPENRHTLAARFGVSVGTIGDIKRRRSWRHL